MTNEKIVAAEKRRDECFKAMNAAVQNEIDRWYEDEMRRSRGEDVPLRVNGLEYWFSRMMSRLS